MKNLPAYFADYNGDTSSKQHYTLVQSTGLDRKPWPKASKEIGERLALHLEKYRCERKKMFGADVFFRQREHVHGGFRRGIFLRLSDEDGLSIKKDIPGAGVFAPTESTVMSEYTSIPASCSDNLDRLDRWIERSYGLVIPLPVKVPKKKG